jgi:hypothetical protein
MRVDATVVAERHHDAVVSRIEQPEFVKVVIQPNPSREDPLGADQLPRREQWTNSLQKKKQVVGSLGEGIKSKR